jgi:hypothetical protein
MKFTCESLWSNSYVYNFITTFDLVMVSYQHFQCNFFSYDNVIMCFHMKLLSFHMCSTQL